MDQVRVGQLISSLLQELGEDPGREGLVKTPERVASALALLTSGYGSHPDEIISDAKFESEANNMIILRDVEVYSLCEHHMLPFFGKCHIGYIPDKYVIGVSKLARVVDCFARRLQIPERMTTQVAHAIMTAIDAKGVGVIMECSNLCMMMRGVAKQNSVMTTSSVLGSFRDCSATRMEFLSLVEKRR